MTATTPIDPSTPAAAGAEPWPTDAHRARMTAAAEAGWNTAMATYEAANERLEDRVTDPKRKEMEDQQLDKAILEDARFAGAIKTAWSAVETAYRAMTLARPPEDGPAGPAGSAPPAVRKATELRRADAESVAESRRRLGAIADGREPAAETVEARETGPAGQAEIDSAGAAAETAGAAGAARDADAETPATEPADDPAEGADAADGSDRADGAAAAPDGPGTVRARDKADLDTPAPKEGPRGKAPGEPRS